jgi:hypothetical protein
LAGGLVAIEQSRYASFLKFREARNRRRIASRKRKLAAKALEEAAGGQADDESE